MNRIAAVFLVLILIACGVLPALAGIPGVLYSPHNLASADEPRVCIFCHTPHHAVTSANASDYLPLWNRDTAATVYTPYASSTISITAVQGRTVGQPQGPSRLCLSCHDGTIALASRSRGMAVDVPSLSALNLKTLSGRDPVLGTNLTDDHPISIEYGLNKEEFADIGTVVNTRVKLVNRLGTPYVECTSCHDAHDNEYGNFLVMDTSAQADALCNVCHIPAGWSGSSHQADSSLSSKGCNNCHIPHAAQRGEALLTLSTVGGNIDSNCTANCHNGTLGRSIGSFTHANGADLAGTKHTGAENLAIVADALPLKQADKHVHCVDCHNPHQAQNSPATPPAPPQLNGVLKGVRGVDIAGMTGNIPYAQFEYEICFRCHSGTAALNESFNAQPSVVRVFDSKDESERFNPGTAKSWHPVAATSVGTGQSLRTDHPQKQINCSDCHNPHGSARPHQLRLDNPDTFSQTQGVAYDLCYSCHDVNYLMSSGTNISLLHSRHVIGPHLNGSTYRASCSTCHDPHGVPSKFAPVATTGSNARHLVNFDTRYAGADSVYNADDQTCLITRKGTSGIYCHATEDLRSYKP